MYAPLIGKKKKEIDRNHSWGNPGVALTRQRLYINYLKYVHRAKGNHRQRTVGNREYYVLINREYP